MQHGRRSDREYEYDGRPYLVMDYIAGGTLKGWIVGKSAPLNSPMGFYCGAWGDVPVREKLNSISLFGKVMLFKKYQKRGEVHPAPG